jgi:hypothetical protein
MYEKFVTLCHAIYSWFKDSWFFGASQELAAGIALVEYLKRRKTIDTVVLNAISMVLDVLSLAKKIKKKNKDADNSGHTDVDQEPTI